MMTHEEMISRATEVLDIEIAGLQCAKKRINEDFCAITEAILHTLEEGGKVVVTGIGKNLHIGEKISATMASTGTTSMLLNPVQAMHGDLGMVTSKDIVLAISYSGESTEVIKLIPALRRLGVKVIGMTGKVDSTLAKDSDWVYLIDCGNEACPFNMAPTTSTTATLALGDALAMVLVDAREFKKESFAILHPAGAIGRTLLFRVKDIMRQGNRLAVITECATVKDAVIAMTTVKAGCACIVDDENNLVGVFTDGDLRRIFSDATLATNPMVTPVAQVMTKNPISIKLNALAVEVLHTFENYKIDDLPVIDDLGKLMGYVDIQDLPRMKIM